MSPTRFICTCPKCGGDVTQDLVSFTGGEPPAARCERCHHVIATAYDAAQSDLHYQRLLERMGIK